MKPWSRASPRDYARLDLRAHQLLADVPLHDVWQLELPGGGDQRSIADVRCLMSLDRIGAANPAVRALLGLRAFLGRIFRWDSANSPSTTGSLAQRLTEEDVRRSLVEPGSPDGQGPFRVLYVDRFEAINEIRNATVYACTVAALQPRPGGYRLFWAIYVSPIGRITPYYMALIDPFRRLIIYPAVLRTILRAWIEQYPEPGYDS